ncbi:MAG: sugar phosphate isomerase/epimerase [Deltaproteobacteria bacterium]|nr:sugar phosphate isomerase/epimerase [Deltaproteobacteria bacterium]MBW2076356.1 sugar phosphate isomerase/epimerase [Deltaproteobacteria bacterium]
MNINIFNETITYQPLDKSYRGLFPFKIATTSYIYPDNILPNIRMLAPYLDEIELVLYESDSLPTSNEITALAEIREEHGLTYNVHLPIDIFLGDLNPAIRNYGAGMVQEIIKLTGLLRPSTYTVHLSLKNPDGHIHADIGQWRMRLSKSIEEILRRVVTPRQISVETLDYPLDLIEEIIEAFDISVCLDFGHLILYEHSIVDYAKRYLARATVVHLHGVRHGRDHLSLEALDENQMKTISSILDNFTGTVSIEVFSFHDLTTSLELLEQYCCHKR